MFVGMCMCACVYEVSGHVFTSDFYLLLVFHNTYLFSLHFDALHHIIKFIMVFNDVSRKDKKKCVLFIPYTAASYIDK